MKYKINNKATDMMGRMRTSGQDYMTVNYKRIMIKIRRIIRVEMSSK